MPVAKAEPPKGVLLETERPQPVSAVKERFKLLCYGLVALFLCAILYGAYWRSQRKQERHESQVELTTASEPAKSSRPVPPTGTGLRPVSSISGKDETQNGATPAIASHPTVAFQPATPPPAAYAGPVGPSAQEQWALQMQQEQWKDLLARRSAPIDQGATNNSPSAGPGTPGPNPLDALATLARLAPHAGGVPGSTPLGASLLPNSSSTDPQDYQQQNEQDAKRRFTQADSEQTALTTLRVDPPSSFVLMQNSHIPVSLDPLLKSDLPGEVTALVRRDVHDSITGKYVLIPAGTKVVGTYNSSVTYGQQNVQVAWTRLIFPDQSSQLIGKMMAYTADGSSGLHDQVDNHWKRTIGGLAMTSLLAAGVQISQSRNNQSVLTYPSTGQLAGAAIGQQASIFGQRLAERNLNVQPTLKIRPGEIFYILVNKDVVFTGPYTPHSTQSALR